LAKQGRSDEAKSLADQIPDAAARARAFTSIAAELAAAGDWEQAQRVANRIPDTEAQSQALMAVRTVSTALPATVNRSARTAVRDWSSMAGLITSS
jgi:thioredoxin-like negative regulator of GroEL